VAAGFGQQQCAGCVIPGQGAPEHGEVLASLRDGGIFRAGAHHRWSDFGNPGAAALDLIAQVRRQEAHRYAAAQGLGRGDCRGSTDRSAIQACAATQLGNRHRVIDGGVDPRGKRHMPLDQRHHHREARIARDEVRGAVERIDEPDRLVLQQQIEPGRIGGNTFFANDQRARHQRAQFARQECFGGVIDLRHHLARRFLGDVGGGKGSEARQDEICGGGPDHLCDGVRKRQRAAQQGIPLRSRQTSASSR
jgi:hypothetical protein